MGGGGGGMGWVWVLEGGTGGGGTARMRSSLTPGGIAQKSAVRVHNKEPRLNAGVLHRSNNVERRRLSAGHGKTEGAGNSPENFLVILRNSRPPLLGPTAVSVSFPVYSAR